jgi:hypothetical protein
VPPPHWNLKHDSPGTWALTGAAAALAIGALFGWVAYVVVLVLTQYVPGSSTKMPAEVIEIQEIGGRYAVCNVRADFSVGWEDTVRVCVAPRYGHAVISDAFSVGDDVELTITENFLGTVLAQVRKVEYGT